jgi:hypothetical protein
MTRKIRTTNAKVRSVAKPYEPAPGERLLMESHFARLAQTPAAPRLKVSDDSSGATEIAPDHPDPRMGLSLLAEALATTDVSFVVGLISQLADAGTRRRKVDERETQFHAVLGERREAKRPDRSHACGANGCCSHRDHDFRVSARQCGKYRAAGQRGTRFQQARPDVRGAGRGAQTIPEPRRSNGPGRARHGERGRTSDRRQCGA